MAKRNSKSRKRTAGCGCTTKNSRNVDLDPVRQKIINMVGNQACEMVHTATEAFEKTANVSMMKYLFEMIGLFPSPAQTQEGPEEESMTRVLFRRLGVPEEVEGQSEVTNDSALEVGTAAGNTVE